MKLQSQLSIAFTTLLVVVMAAAWYVIYSLILDLLIQDEQRQLEQTGEILVDILNQQYSSYADIEQFYQILREQDLQMVLYDRNFDRVLFSTLSNEAIQGLYRENDFYNRNDSLWEYRTEKFVTSRIMFLPESSGLEMILLTPLDNLRVVQKSFFLRLFLVFLIGALLVVAITYYMTNKLVTPLTRLKWQLKKIEKREFKDIDRINATGEIKEVADSVYDMANELQRYINTQQTFFQNASHELKTPLMTIQGYAEGIKDGIFDKKEAEKGLSVMVSEVNRLKSIINEMIFLAKLESESTLFKPQMMNVKDIVKKVVDRTLPIVHEKGIALRYEVENNSAIYADEDKLLRALLNVVMNGIRHAKSEVKLRVVAEGNQTKIIIEDDGDGIAEDLLPHIFHRFVKGKNGETGLGLAITRAIVEQLNGKITAGVSEQGGAQFIITLPSNNKKN